MPAPQYVRRSYGGGAAAAQLVNSMGSSDTAFSVAPTTGWVEEDGSPLGTVGPFTIAIDRFTPSVEKVLCSAINLTTGQVTVYVDPSDNWSGRGYDGTPAQAHVPGGSASGVQNVWSSVEADEANQAVVDVLGAGGIGSLGVPVGSMIAYGNNASDIPTNFLPCDGRLISRTTYPACFAAITGQGTCTTTAGNVNITALSLNGLYYTGTAIDPASPMKLTLTNSAGAIYTINTTSTSSLTVTSGTGITAGINGGIVIYPFGPGDGSTTFGLPDTRGRFLVGQSTLGTTGQQNLQVGEIGNTQAVTSTGRQSYGVTYIIRVQ